VNNDNHLTTGVLGTKYMPEALAQLGRADVAWNIINQKTYPSWNIMMEKYTTMCEFWTLKQSKNHVMMGSIDAWFYKYIAGIRLNEEAPTFKSFVIHPNMLKDLDHASGSTETIRGKVTSEWKTENGNFNLYIEIPFNTTAEVFIPAAENTKIFEGNQLAEKVEGIQSLGFAKGFHQYRVGSGRYKFVVKGKQNE
jgi:alpha-L-rhamnosidase